MKQSLLCLLLIKCYIHFFSISQLLQGTLANLAENSHLVKQAEGSQPSEERRKTLTSRIIAVHVVYHSVEEHIHWFGQLTAQYPGIVSSLAEMSLEMKSMVGTNAVFLCFLVLLCEHLYDSHQLPLVS